MFLIETQQNTYQTILKKLKSDESIILKETIHTFNDIEEFFIEYNFGLSIKIDYYKKQNKISISFIESKTTEVDKLYSVLSVINPFFKSALSHLKIFKPEKIEFFYLKEKYGSSSCNLIFINKQFKVMFTNFENFSNCLIVLCDMLNNKIMNDNYNMQYVNQFEDFLFNLKISEVEEVKELFLVNNVSNLEELFDYFQEIKNIEKIYKY